MPDDQSETDGGGLAPASWNAGETEALASLRRLERRLGAVERTLLDVQDRIRFRFPDQTGIARALSAELTEALRRPFPGLFTLPARVLELYAEHRRLERRPLRDVDADRAFSPWNGPLEERVSVVMTTYESADFLGPSIEAVLAQTYQNIELIVVDDASSDDSHAIARDFAARDARVRPIRLLDNGGTYAAKNLGIRRATGAFFANHDSDDFAHPDWLALHVGALKRHPAAMMAASAYVRTLPDGRIQPNRGLRERRALQSMVFRRTPVLQKIGYFDSVRGSADIEYFERLCVAFGDGAWLEITLPLYEAAVRPGQLTQETEVRQDTSEFAPPEAFLEPSLLAYTEAFQAWHREIREGRTSPRVGFPLLGRPFPVADALQSDKGQAGRRMLCLVRDRADQQLGAWLAAPPVPLAAVLASGASDGDVQADLLPASAEDAAQVLADRLDQTDSPLVLVLDGTAAPPVEDVLAELMIAADAYGGTVALGIGGHPLGQARGEVDLPAAALSGPALARQGALGIPAFATALIALLQNDPAGAWKAGLPLAVLRAGVLPTGSGRPSGQAPAVRPRAAATAMVTHLETRGTPGALLGHGIDIALWRMLAAGQDE